MYIATWTAEKGWDEGTIQPYGPISIMPSAQVLNYGQAAFEGMKAQESAKGRVVIFRPDKNAERLKAGALRLSMPPVPEAQFVSAVQSLVSANKDWVGARGGLAQLPWRLSSCCSGPSTTCDLLADRFLLSEKDRCISDLS